MRALLLLTALLLAPAASAAEYALVATPYTSIANFTGSCGTGPCANFPPGARASGSFTTSAPLPANATNFNALPLVTSFSFSDGINTFTSADPDVRVYTLEFTTDGSGTIVSGLMGLQRWLSGPAPHVPADRVVNFSVSVPGVVGVFHNTGCGSVGTAPSGVGDACTTLAPDTLTSTASGIGIGAWRLVVPGIPVPTLAHGALVLLAVAVAAAGLHRRARTRQG